MNDTQVETQLRETLQAHAATTSFDPVGAAARARGLARHRTHRSYAALGAVAACLAAVTLAVTLGQDAVTAPTPPQTGAPVYAVATSPTEVAGTWTAVSVRGEPVAKGRQAPRLVITRFGSGGGFDGCNDTAGTFRLSADGVVTAEQYVSTAMGCGPGAEDVTAVATGNTLARAGSELVVRTRDGSELARYELTKPEAPPTPVTRLDQLKGSWLAVNAGNAATLVFGRDGDRPDEWASRISSCDLRGGTLTLDGRGGVTARDNWISDSACTITGTEPGEVLPRAASLVVDSRGMLILVAADGYQLAQLTRPGR